MQKINYVEDSTKEVLVKRSKKALEVIREKDGFGLVQFIDYVNRNAPEFMSFIGASKVQRTWYLKNPNIRVVELLEEFANKIKSLPEENPQQTKIA